MMNEFFVKIFQLTENGPDEMIKVMGPFSQRKAEKIEAGVNINLDHDNFYTMVTERVSVVE